MERPIRYVRENFVYGREFLGDVHLDAEQERWLTGTANVRIHATTKERPTERFEQSERSVLLPLAERPYQSRLLIAPKRRKPSTPVLVLPTRLEVEQRPLAAYDALVAGAA